MKWLKIIQSLNLNARNPPSKISSRKCPPGEQWRGVIQHCSPGAAQQSRGGGGCSAPPVCFHHIAVQPWLGSIIVFYTPLSPFYNVSDFHKAFTGRENETPNEGTNLHSNLKYLCFLACQLKCMIDRTSLLDLLRTSGMPLENSACSWSNSTHLFRYKAPHMVNLTSSLRCVLVWGRNQKNILYKSRFVELLHAEWKVYIWVF